MTKNSVFKSIDTWWVALISLFALFFALIIMSQFNLRSGSADIAPQVIKGQAQHFQLDIEGDTLNLSWIGDESDYGGSSPGYAAHYLGSSLRDWQYTITSTKDDCDNLADYDFTEADDEMLIINDLITSIKVLAEESSTIFQEESRHYLCVKANILESYDLDEQSADASLALIIEMKIQASHGSILANEGDTTDYLDLSWSTEDDSRVNNQEDAWQMSSNIASEDCREAMDYYQIETHPPMISVNEDYSVCLKVIIQKDGLNWAHFHYLPALNSIQVEEDLENQRLNLTVAIEDFVATTWLSAILNEDEKCQDKTTFELLNKASIDISQINAPHHYCFKAEDEAGHQIARTYTYIPRAKIALEAKVNHQSYLVISLVDNKLYEVIEDSWRWAPAEEVDTDCDGLDDYSSASLTNNFIDTATLEKGIYYYCFQYDLNLQEGAQAPLNNPYFTLVSFINGEEVVIELTKSSSQIMAKSNYEDVIKDMSYVITYASLNQCHPTHFERFTVRQGSEAPYNSNWDYCFRGLRADTGEYIYAYFNQKSQVIPNEKEELKPPVIEASLKDGVITFSVLGDYKADSWQYVETDAQVCDENIFTEDNIQIFAQDTIALEFHEETDNSHHHCLRVANQEGVYGYYATQSLSPPDPADKSNDNEQIKDLEENNTANTVIGLILMGIAFLAIYKIFFARKKEEKVEDSEWFNGEDDDF